MSYSGCSGNASSCSLRGSLCQPGSSCGSSYPSNLVYTSALCPSSPCQPGSSLYSGCQETSCQMPCYGPRTPRLCSPCPTTRPLALGCGPSSSCSVGCGSSGFRPQGYGVCGFPSQSCGSGSCRPNYLPSRVTQSSCYRPSCGSNCY